MDIEFAWIATALYALSQCAAGTVAEAPNVLACLLHFTQSGSLHIILPACGHVC